MGVFTILEEPMAHRAGNVHFAKFCCISCTGPYDVGRTQLSTGDKLAGGAVQL